jgi:hypothetical protein
MRVLAYNDKEHRHQLEIWWRQWNISAYSLELLSDTGLIIPDHGCLFMYETNSPIILFENLVSNKEISNEERDEAVQELVSVGKQYAKYRGYKQILLTTNNKSILARAKEDNCIISDNMFYSIFKEV